METSMQCNTHGSIVERDDALLGGAVTDFFPINGTTLRGAKGVKEKQPNRIVKVNQTAIGNDKSRDYRNANSQSKASKEIKETNKGNKGNNRSSKAR